MTKDNGVSPDIVLEHMGIIRQWVSRTIPYGEQDDAIQHVTMYALEHLDSYDPGMSKASTFLWWKARGGCTDYERHLSKVRREVPEADINNDVGQDDEDIEDPLSFIANRCNGGTLRGVEDAVELIGEIDDVLKAAEDVLREKGIEWPVTIDIVIQAIEYDKTKGDGKLAFEIRQRYYQNYIKSVVSR